MPPLPTESSSFPACFEPAKWEGETQDGGSRELWLQPPAVRLPDLVSGGATRGGVAWPGPARAGWAAHFSQRAEWLRHLGTDEAEQFVGPSGVRRNRQPGPRY